MKFFFRIIINIFIVISIILALFAAYVLVAGTIGESRIENINKVKDEKIDQLGFSNILKENVISKLEEDFLSKNRYYFLREFLTCPTSEIISIKDPNMEYRQRYHSKCVLLGISDDTFRRESMLELMSLDASAKQIDVAAKKEINSIRSFAFLDGDQVNNDLMIKYFLISVVFIVLTASISAISFFRGKSQEMTNL